MRFTSSIAIKNIKRRPFRTVATAVLVMFLSFTVFAGAFTIISLQNGLSSYRARLGADIVVVPSSATSHGAVDDIFLQGITGNYYMSAKECDKVMSTEGIEAATTQFFLTSAKASCCSVRVQIIGFDPKTDFSIQPWIRNSYKGTLSDGDVIVGADVNAPLGGTITFYGKEYNVAAQLERTGTGLDSAVYTNMNTIKEMANNAANLIETNAFKGVDIDTAASAILIKVAPGYEISDVADDINIHITKVQATSARNMISDISSGLSSVSQVIGGLVAAIWVLAVIILIAVFALLSNERKKEFAVLRTVGASQKMLFGIMACEATLISAFGAVLGLVFALVTVFALSDTLRSTLGLPFLMPNAGVMTALAAGAVAISLCAGLLTSLISARRITKSETGLLLREDA